MPDIAVLTADVINSTEISHADLNVIMDELRGEIGKFKSSGLIVYYEIFRGDAAQIIVPQAEQALRVALTLKTAINRINIAGISKRGQKIQHDVRFAIGVGETAKKNLTKLTNEIAFVRSGKELDRISDAKISVGAVTGHYQADRELETELFLFEGIMKEWSLATAEVVYHKLLGKTEQVIAGELGISQSAVNQHSHTAYWNGLHVLIKRYEEVIRSITDE